MAEHLLRRMAADAGVKDLAVASAGVSPANGLEFPKEAAKALAAEGVTVSHHRPAGLEKAQIDKADFIFALEPAHREAIVRRFPQAASKTHVLKSYAGTAAGGKEGVDDPFGGDDEDYRTALKEIKTALAAIIRKWK